MVSKPPRCSAFLRGFIQPGRAEATGSVHSFRSQRSRSLGHWRMTRGTLIDWTGQWFQTTMAWRFDTQRFKMIYGKKANEHCCLPMMTPLLPNHEDLLLFISRLYDHPVDHDFLLAVNTIKHFTWQSQKMFHIQKTLSSYVTGMYCSATLFPGIWTAGYAEDCDILWPISPWWMRRCILFL
jgi:hypothetical protein